MLKLNRKVKRIQADAPPPPKSQGLLAKSTPNRLPLVIGITLGLGGLNTLGLMVLAIVCLRLTNPPTVLVQTQNGEALAAVQTDANHRHPQVIQRFIERELGLLFTWNGLLPTQPGETPKPDPGTTISVDNQRAKIPTGTSMAQFGLAVEDNFRAGFIQQLADLVPSQVFSGDLTQVLEINSMSKPYPVGEGRWKVQVVATRILIAKGGRFEHVPFNRDIYVRAVHRPIALSETTQVSGYREVMVMIRRAGLEIYAMREFKRGEYQ